MPRPLWAGSITFGLVNVPVRIYSAVKEHRLTFHLVHEPDGGAIGYRKVCKQEDREVPDEEIVKAHEVSKGKDVYLTDEDFDAAKVEGYKTIEITDFVPYAEIDPIYFARTYYVGPDEGAEKVYALLTEAMSDSELAAIAKFVMRDRQHLGALRVREGVITLEQLHFADEIRPVDELRPRRARVDKRERQMAAQLIDSFTGEWEPDRYHDTYREALLEVIEAKRKGKEVHRAAEPEEAEAPDLMAALRKSLEQAKRPQKRGGGRTSPARRRARPRKATAASRSRK